MQVRQQSYINYLMPSKRRELQERIRNDNCQIIYLNGQPEVQTSQSLQQQLRLETTQGQFEEAKSQNPLQKLIEKDKSRRQGTIKEKRPNLTRKGQLKKTKEEEKSESKILPDFLQNNEVEKILEKRLQLNIDLRFLCDVAQVKVLKFECDFECQSCDQKFKNVVSQLKNKVLIINEYCCNEYSINLQQKKQEIQKGEQKNYKLTISTMNFQGVKNLKLKNLTFGIYCSCLFPFREEFPIKIDKWENDQSIGYFKNNENFVVIILFHFIALRDVVLIVNKNVGLAQEVTN